MSTLSRQYFNLIVRADSSQAMLPTRMLEGSSQSAVQQFGFNGQYDLNALAELPTVMVEEFKEDDTSTIATVGYIDVPSLNPTISNPVMRVPANELLRRIVAGRWWNTRTHWAVLEGDIFRLLAGVSILASSDYQSSQEVTPSEGIIVKPIVFSIPQSVSTDDICAIMMPLKPGFEPVRNVIKEACASVSLSPIVADEIWNAPSIVQDVFDTIYGACVVVCDFSGPNPNVMYEMGIAHTLGKAVIPITQRIEPLPFDVAHYRTIVYENTPDGLNRLEQELCKALRSICG